MATPSQFETKCTKAGVLISRAKAAIMAALDIQSKYPDDDEALTLWKFVQMGHIDRCTPDQAMTLIALARPSMKPSKTDES